MPDKEISDLQARRRRANSFGDAAQAYERGRPPYPEAAIDWMLPARARRVLDLGAGTGKLTRQLLARGLGVIAVEPSAGMRAELARALPSLTPLDGAAEAIPLSDSSVDAAFVAQAWHWVDPPRAVAEVARVLAPGGRLGLIWNVRDEREDWVAKLGGMVGSDAVRDAMIANPIIGAPFGPIETRTFAWTNRIGRGELIDLVASRSHAITLDPAGRAVLFKRLEALMAEHPALKDRAEIEVPYVTYAYRADKPG